MRRQAAKFIIWIGQAILRFGWMLLGHKWQGSVVEPDVYRRRS